MYWQQMFKRAWARGRRHGETPQGCSSGGVGEYEARYDENQGGKEGGATRRFATREEAFVLTYCLFLVELASMVNKNGEGLDIDAKL